MAAVYYLGSKQVTTKKGERVVCSLLCHDGFQNPTVRQFWIDKESDVAALVLDLLPGCAVRCQTVFGDERTLAYIEENLVPPVLDLTAFLDTSIH